MPLGTQVGLGPGDSVLDGDPASPHKGWHNSPLPSFRPICLLWPTAGWIKMPFGTEVGLGPGHIVSDEKPAPPKRGNKTAPNFRSISVVDKRLDGLGCHLI